MVRRPRMRWTLGIAAAALAAATTAPMVAGPAMASTGTNIDGNGINSNEYQAGYYNCHDMMNNYGTLPYCLFYGQDFGSLVWGTKQQTVGTISGNFYYTNGIYSSYPVRNDAASMIDVTGNCNVTTWVSPN